MAKLRELNAQQEKFCVALAGGCNQTQAAIAAGYSVKSAGPIACGLLKQPHITERLAQLQAQAADRAVVSAGITKDWVLNELVTNSKQARALGDISASNGALIAIGKELRMFVDRSESVVQTIESIDDSGLHAILAAAREARAHLAARQAEPVALVESPSADGVPTYSDPAESPREPV